MMRLPHRILCSFMALVIVATSGTPLPAYAQQNADATTSSNVSGLDLQPPRIELTEQTSGIAGSDQMFAATVTDDIEVKLVELYYRRAGESGYINLPMQASAGGSSFTVSVATNASDQRAIEYYVQAEDRAGNRAIKGYIFDPLVRELTPDQSLTANTTQAEPNRRWVWGVLGLVAILALAGAASSGGSDDPSPTPGGPITIDVTPVP